MGRFEEAPSLIPLQPSEFLQERQVGHQPATKKVAHGWWRANATLEASDLTTTTANVKVKSSTLIVMLILTAEL